MLSQVLIWVVPVCLVRRMWRWIRFNHHCQWGR
jgi:hypothetical protein